MYEFGEIGADGFTESALCAISHAIRRASQMGHTYVGTEHLLLGLLSDEGSAAASILKRFSVDYSGVESRISELIGSESNDGLSVKLPTVKSDITGAGSFKDTPTLSGSNVLFLKFKVMYGFLSTSTSNVSEFPSMRKTMSGSKGKSVFSGLLTPFFLSVSVSPSVASLNGK